jgi:hypothetical protein
MLNLTTTSFESGKPDEGSVLLGVALVSPNGFFRTNVTMDRSPISANGRQAANIHRAIPIACVAVSIVAKPAAFATIPI